MKHLYNNKERLAYLILAIVISFNLSLSVFADGEPKNFVEAKASHTIPSQRFEIRLVDEVGVLSDDECTDILSRLDSISKENDVDVVIAVVKNTGDQNIVAFADDYFDYNGFGLGKNREDGILLLVSIEDKKWAISTAGFCIDAFIDDGQAYIMDKCVLPELKQNLFYVAFTKFTDFADKFIVKAKTDKPYTEEEIKKFSRNWTSPLWYALPIGLLIAIGIILYDVYNLPYSIKEKYANNYLVSGSAKISSEKDIFLFREHKSYATSSSSDSSGSSSGGSSTHISSSGRTHGGSSGSF